MELECGIEFLVAGRQIFPAGTRLQTVRGEGLTTTIGRGEPGTAFIAFWFKKESMKHRFMITHEEGGTVLFFQKPFNDRLRIRSSIDVIANKNELFCGGQLIKECVELMDATVDIAYDPCHSQ